MDIGVNVIQQREHHSSKLVPSLKQLSLFSSLLALLADLLSFAGLLPFTGGYSFTIVGFASGRQLVDAIRGRLSSGVLFVLMNAIIVVILSTSGCFNAVGDQPDTGGSSATADFLPAPVPLDEEQEQHEENSLAEEQAQHEEKQPPQRSFSMPRQLEEEELEDQQQQQQQHAKKALRKVKRQVSSPAALSTAQPSQRMRTKAIVVGKPRPAKAASFHAPAAAAAATAAAAKGPFISDSFNLVTCEQEVFNQIVESYIDKFRQDMRQQEMHSVVNGQLFASRAPNW